MVTVITQTNDMKLGIARLQLLFKLPLQPESKSHFLALTPTDFADCARPLLPASLENKAGEIRQQKLQI